MKINRNNYEEYFIAYAENMLPPAERSEVEIFIQNNPELRTELELFKQTILKSDDSLVYPFKENLKKQEQTEVYTLRPAIRKWYEPALVAASLLLLFGVYYFFFRNEKQIPEKKIVTVAPKDSVTKPNNISGNNIIIPNKTGEQPITKKEPKKIISPKENKIEKEIVKIETPPVENEIPKIEEKPNEKISPKENVVQNTIEEKQPVDSTLAINPLNETIKNETAVVKKIYTKSKKREIKNFWDVLAVLTNSVAKKTNMDMSMKKQDNGNLYAFSFNTDKVKIYKTINKNSNN